MFLKEKMKNIKKRFLHLWRYQLLQRSTSLVSYFVRSKIRDNYMYIHTACMNVTSEELQCDSSTPSGANRK